MVNLAAKCILVGETVKGNLTFQQVDGGKTHVTGQVTGLAAGKHGFHIHQFGDYSAGCGSTGGHFNPFGKNHGAPTAADRHAGDLGNIEADGTNPVMVDITDNQLPLSGENSIIGRAIVVHAGEDDLGLGGHNDSLTTGHAGARLACGVIGISKPEWLNARL